MFGRESSRREFLGFTGAAATCAAISATGCGQAPGRLRKFGVSYPTRSGAAWPLWIAAHGGYFAQYGLDPNLVFGVHPAGVASLISGDAQMIISGMEQIIAAVVRDPELVIMGSSLNRGNLALLARPEIQSGAGLKGKKIGVGRLGDPIYFYTLDLLRKYGLSQNDVQWVATGADASVRASMLASGGIDAVLLTPPSFFKLQAQGLRVLANLADFPDIYISIAIIFKKSYAAANPTVAEAAIKAQAEAVKRFYTDKPFAIEAYKVYDPQQDPEALSRVYDLYASKDVLDRVPILRVAALRAAADRLVDQVPDIKAFNFKAVVDNSVVTRLIKEGWFEKLFGPSISEEQAQRLKEAA